MNKKILLDTIQNHIGKTANEVNPQKTANAIYFIFKQNNINCWTGKTYVSVLKSVKSYLKDEFHWSWMEVHACFCHLNSLLKK